MAARRRFRRARPRRRRRSLSASNWGPILKLLAATAVFLGLIYALLYIAVPKAAEVIGFDYKPPFAPDVTPSPTPRPTPTPNPIKVYNFAENTGELVLDSSAGNPYKWFTDPYFYGGKMIITGGRLDSTGKNVLLNTMFYFEPESRTTQKLPLSPQNDHFIFPKFNDRWLVYMDSKLSGGGAIMAVDLTSPGSAPVKVKDIYSGQPEPFLSGDYVAFTDRTGTLKDKLFVYDLNTMESTVIAMFTKSVYGQSKPFFSGTILGWADSANTGESSETSVIRYIDINSSTVESVETGTFVHDPEYNGRYCAWLSGLHGRDTGLYAMDGFRGSPVLIDSGVVEFGLGSDFVAYSRDEKLFVYSFPDKSIYRLTQDYESAMFLGVSDNYVIWMDVTSRERDIVKFIRIP